MWRGEESEGDRGEVENILAGVGGERWTMLEAVCTRLELSAVALATSAWLLEGWPVEGERDEVCDRIWRAWDRLGDARLIEVMQGLDAWSRELVTTIALALPSSRCATFLVKCSTINCTFWVSTIYRNSRATAPAAAT